jgi:hypothetical protein
MKKVLSLAFVSAVLLLGCSEGAFKNFFDELSKGFDNLQKDLTGNLLQGNIGNLNMGFAPGQGIPVGDDFSIEVEVNNIVINGGSAIVDVTSEEKLSKLFLNIEGENPPGVYQIDLEDVACSPQGEICRIVEGKYLYTLSVLLNQDPEKLSDGESLEITFSGLSEDNQQSEPVKEIVTVKEVGFGDLQVSLSWNNADDLDLYVEIPSGEKIFFGNREVDNGKLDLDAEAGCRPDNIRNENIYFTVPLNNGSYKVSVRVYTKCGTSTGAAYSVSAFHNGEIFDFAGKKQQGRFGDADNNDKEIAIGTITVQNGNVVKQQ